MNSTSPQYIFPVAFPARPIKSAAREFGTLKVWLPAHGQADAWERGRALAERLGFVIAQAGEAAPVEWRTRMTSEIKSRVERFGAAIEFNPPPGRLARFIARIKKVFS